MQSFRIFKFIIIEVVLWDNSICQEKHIYSYIQYILEGRECKGTSNMELQVCVINGSQHSIGILLVHTPHGVI